MRVALLCERHFWCWSQEDSKSHSSTVKQLIIDSNVPAKSCDRVDYLGSSEIVLCNMCGSCACILCCTSKKFVFEQLTLEMVHLSLFANQLHCSIVFIGGHLNLKLYQSHVRVVALPIQRRLLLCLVDLRLKRVESVLMAKNTAFQGKKSSATAKQKNTERLVRAHLPSSFEQGCTSEVKTPLALHSVLRHRRNLRNILVTWRNVQG